MGKTSVCVSQEYQAVILWSDIIYNINSKINIRKLYIPTQNNFDGTLSVFISNIQQVNLNINNSISFEFGVFIPFTAFVLF